MDELESQYALPSNDVTESCSSEIEHAPTQNPLSKNQQKKLIRNQKWQAAKLLKKEIKKKRKNSDISTDTNDVKPQLSEEEIARKRERKMREQEEYIALCRRNYGIVIDCAWEDEHTDSTLISLVQQLAFCYGINKRSPTPSLIYVTGLGPRTQAQLSKNNAFNWTGVLFTEKEYMDMQELVSPAITSPQDGLPLPAPQAASPPKELVYLTSDASETIDTLDANCTYIIGGIVDRNRLKGVTYSKAHQQGIRTAKLPIREHCQMKATHVLTINHVFDILKGFDAHHSWAEAIEKVIPSRKKGELLGNVKAREEKESHGRRLTGGESGGDGAEQTDHTDGDDAIDS